MSRYASNNLNAIENQMVVGDYYPPGDSSEYPKAIICPRCDSTKLFSKFTINTLTGAETEEEVRCEQCDFDGKIWVFDPADEKKWRDA